MCYVGPLQHPQLCIDAVEHGVRNGGRSGLQAEAMAFAKAQALPVHKALVHMFFAQRTTKNVRLHIAACLAPCICSTHQLSCLTASACITT